MAFSNLVAFFIILTTAVTLHASASGKIFNPRPTLQKRCTLRRKIRVAAFRRRHHRHRTSRRPGSRRVGSLRHRGNFSLARQSRAQAHPGAQVLLRPRLRNHPRHRAELPGNEPHSRALFIRGNQWPGGSPADGDAHVDVPEAGDRWQVCFAAISASGGVDRNGRHAGGVTGISVDHGAASIGALKSRRVPR